MTELDLDFLLRRVEETPDVRAAFAEALHEQLAAELGYRSRPRSGPFDLIGRLRDLGSLRAASPAVRLAWAGALLALLVVASLGLLSVASQLLRPRPEDLVRLSQLAYERPPAFSETFLDSTGASHRLSTDGAGTWRIDEVRPDGTPSGTYDLFDGTREGHYDATGRVWNVGLATGLSGGMPPFPLATEFVWERTVGTPGSVPHVEKTPCAAPEALEPAVVAGRAADLLVCSDSGMRVWLDRDSYLVLRIQAGPATPGWDPGAGMTATAFSTGSAPDPSLFSWDGPAGAFAPNAQPPSHSLVTGDPLPELTGRLIDGSTYDSTSLAGRPAAILVWCTCVQGPEMRIFAGAVARRTDQLGAALIMEATPTEARAAASDVAFVGATVVDDGNVLDSLGLNYYPVMLLVDAGGRIRSLSHQVGSAPVLDSMLDALVGDSPIPSPSWAPRRSTGSDGVSSRLAIGEMAPSWAVQLPGGGMLATSGLLGEKSIVYYGSPAAGGDYDAPRSAMLAALYRAATAQPPPFRLVIVDAQPYTADAAQAALTRLGIDQEIVPDRDGAIGLAWGLPYFDDLVFLDEAGRVVWFGAGSCLDTATLLRDFSGGSPMPSPTMASSGPGCP